MCSGVEISVFFVEISVFWCRDQCVMCLGVEISVFCVQVYKSICSVSRCKDQLQCKMSASASLRNLPFWPHRPLTTRYRAQINGLIIHCLYPKIDAACVGMHACVQVFVGVCAWQYSIGYTFVFFISFLPMSQL